MPLGVPIKYESSHQHKYSFFLFSPHSIISNTFPIRFLKSSSSLMSNFFSSFLCFLASATSYWKQWLSWPMHDIISLCKAVGRYNWLNRYRKKKEAIVWYKHGNAFLLTSSWSWSKSACQSLEWDNSVSRYLYLWAPRVVKVWWTGWRSSEWEGERLRKKKIRFGEILWWAEKKSPYFGRRRWIIPVFFCVKSHSKPHQGGFE